MRLSNKRSKCVPKSSTAASSFWLFSAAIFVALSTIMLYSSCANAMSKEWHRERDRDRRYKQQLRRRQHLYNSGGNFDDNSIPGHRHQDFAPEGEESGASLRNQNSQEPPPPQPTLEEPVIVVPEDEIMGDDETLLPPDIKDAVHQSSPVTDSRAQGLRAEEDARFSPWSPTSWKRRFTSFFSGFNGGNKRGGSTGGSYSDKKEEDLTDEEREARFLNLFTVVRFNNTGCVGDTGDNGTCYTANECIRQGGVIGGRCAGNFGVCCVFIKTCGQNSSANCTYFVNQGYPGSVTQPGSCQLAINKCAPDVCQLRLDFLQFEIGGPSNDATNAPTTVGQCLNDQFLVTSSGGSVTPVICGLNTGQHMYIDVSALNQASVLTFVTSSNLVGVANRSWKVKITQIKCGSTSAAISGCMQYFTGVTGRVSSYNYNNAQGVQLANQAYSACVRMEAGFCGIRYSQCTDSLNTPSQSFSISGNSAAGAGLGSSTGQNCANGQDKDWVGIPCASTQPFSIQNTQANSFCVDRLCGNVLNPVDGQNTAAQIYSSRKPFVIYYQTDGTETGSTNNRGFCLDYVQQPCAPNSG